MNNTFKEIKRGNVSSLLEIKQDKSKTIDMKAEEMIINYVVSNGTTTERLNDSDVIILMNDYANQRIIEELEELIDGLDEFELHSDFPYLINKRIKELKQ